MIQNDFTIHIRRAESGDEACLAHVQTESWKAAFAGIVPAELLTQCTSIERAEKMYARLLAEQQGNGYILELDGKPHCVGRRAQRGYAGCCRAAVHPFAAGKLVPRLRQPDDGARSRGRKGCRTTGRCAAEMQEDGILKKSRAKHVLPWTGAARRHQQQRRRV